MRSFEAGGQSHSTRSFVAGTTAWVSPGRGEACAGAKRVSPTEVLSADNLPAASRQMLLTSRRLVLLPRVGGPFFTATLAPRQRLIESGESVGAIGSPPVDMLRLLSPLSDRSQLDEASGLDWGFAPPAATGAPLVKYFTRSRRLTPLLHLPPFRTASTNGRTHCKPRQRRAAPCCRRSQ